MARFRRSRTVKSNSINTSTEQTTVTSTATKAGRRDITASLTLAANSFWLKRGFSCFNELGLESWGRLRADVLCLKLDGTIILNEVKSSVADYRTDNKWPTYRKYANQCYFVMQEDVYEKLRPTEYEKWKEHGFGVMVLQTKGKNAGYLRIAVGSTRQLMKRKRKTKLIVRMAWRNGISKRTNRRQRVFL